MSMPAKISATGSKGENSTTTFYQKDLRARKPPGPCENRPLCVVRFNITIYCTNVKIHFKPKIVRAELRLNLGYRKYYASSQGDFLRGLVREGTIHLITWKSNW